MHVMPFIGASVDAPMALIHAQAKKLTNSEIESEVISLFKYSVHPLHAHTPDVQ